MALLEIRDLKVNYGPIHAIRGIDLDVDEGSIVALLGANGAGKTTTLRTISGVIKPGGGSIRLAGQEISQLRACKIDGCGHDREVLELGLDDSLLGVAMLDDHIVHALFDFGF